MKILVGLGNPGNTYKNNRHNVGYMLIDYLLEKFQKRYKLQVTSYKNNELQLISYKLQDLILAKPLTFMNQSGLAVKQLIKSYKLQVTSYMIVVHDDLDIPLGKFKIQKGVGPQLHNGIESIEKALGTKDFWRVRIGIDNRSTNHWIDGETYVLQNFKSDEKKIIFDLFPIIWNRIDREFLSRAY